MSNNNNQVGDVKSFEIAAPFSESEVEKINRWQENSYTHPFTCCGHNDCDRSKQPNEGRLLATNEGLSCPCGAWKQNWAHSIMLQEPKNIFGSSTE